MCVECRFVDEVAIGTLPTRTYSRLQYHWCLSLARWRKGVTDHRIENYDLELVLSNENLIVKGRANNFCDLILVCTSMSQPPFLFETLFHPYRRSWQGHDVSTEISWISPFAINRLCSAGPICRFNQQHSSWIGHVDLLFILHYYTTTTIHDIKVHMWCLLIHSMVSVRIYQVKVIYM